MPDDDRLDPDMAQSFTVDRDPDTAIEAAATYLHGAGAISPSLQGRMERFGTSLAVHHGRIRTSINATATSAATRVEVRRSGQAPLEETRRWLYAIGLGGFLIAVALTWYNEQAAEALPPLATVAVFFLAVVLVLAVLFVADRSLERRSESIIMSIEDAIKGDPMQVLQREVDALERSSSLANGLIFYCGALLLEFLVFIIVLSDGIREGINEAAALQTLRFGLLIPIAPALLFAGLYFVWVNRVHDDRFGQLRRTG